MPQAASVEDSEGWWRVKADRSVAAARPVGASAGSGHDGGPSPASTWTGALDEGGRVRNAKRRRVRRPTPPIAASPPRQDMRQITESPTTVVAREQHATQIGLGHYRADWRTEVDPVSWTPEHLCSRSLRWRRQDHPTHRNSVARWSSWYAPAARPEELAHEFEPTAQSIRNWRVSRPWAVSLEDGRRKSSD
jgi:hypothetical protein